MNNSRRQLMEKFFISLLLILITVSYGLAQASAPRSLVSVVGEAEMAVSPDQALFTLEVITLDKDLAAAKKANDIGVSKTLATARAQQISDRDVQTVSFSITPKYSTPKEARGERVFISYEITKRISITLKDLSKIDSFLGNVLGSGVNRVVDISFENSQIRKYREQVRAMAVKNAQDKARAYARQLGQTIGKAYSITEEGAEGAYVGSGSGNGIGDGDSENDTIDAKQSLVSREVTFAVGQIKVEERIIVSFFLE